MNLITIFFRGLLCLAIATTVISPAMAQQTQGIKGVVRDATSGEVLPGVTVRIKNTNTGAITDPSGGFSLTAQPTSILNVSYIGYDSQDITVGSQTIIEIALKEKATNFGDLVVIGYGITTKREVTGSVTSLKAEDFNKGTFTDPMGLLQGKVAGLSIANPNGGDPNGKLEILLRGNNTLTGDQQPLIIIDGVTGADLRTINFQEVESIDVLKDGSAAAIYGTRGTNGVIIITTKRARAGTTQVEYDGQISAQAVTRRATPMTAREFAWTVKRYKPDNIDKLYGANTDWFDEITRTPVSHKHSLAVSGGSKAFSHRTVLNVDQNQGLQKRNDVSKYLIKTNIHQTALNGWLDLDYNIYGSKRQYSPANKGAFRQAFWRNPTEPIYDPTNTDSGGYFTKTSSDYFNPVAMINERTQENQADNMGGTVRATLNVLSVPGLKWDNTLTYTQERFESRDYKTRYYPSELGRRGIAVIGNEYSNDKQWESTLSYIKQFEKHTVQGIAGYSYQEDMSQSSGMENSGYNSDIWETDNISAGDMLNQGMADMSSYKGMHKYIAFFGRVMYNYDEKYLASISLRRDGSTRFGQNNKWANFPAVSLGWRISQEDFMVDVKWVDELKLRVGYGVTGNQAIPNYQSQILMGTDGYYYYDSEWIQSYKYKNNPNPDLRWEKKNEFNTGLDFVFFGGRLSGAIDYYNRKTTDLIYEYEVPVPPYITDKMMVNLGQITNSGVEIMISGIPVQTKDFKWNTTATFSKNSNKLSKITSAEFNKASFAVGWLNSPMAQFSQFLKEGDALGTFYAPRWLGVGADGQDILQGADSNGEVDQGKWQKIGSAYPDFVLGWSNTLTYRNFDMNVMVRASIGGKAFNSYRANYENITELGLRNVLGDWLDDRKFTGKSKYSSKYIEDATYYEDRQRFVGLQSRPQVVDN